MHSLRPALVFAITIFSTIVSVSSYPRRFGDIYAFGDVYNTDLNPGSYIVSAKTTLKIPSVPSPPLTL